MEFAADYIFTGTEDGLIENAVLNVDNGIITHVEPTAAARPGSRRLIVPALVNAHDHARPTASSFGAADLPLETWLARTAFGAPPDPYLAAAASLARSAQSGCASMMVHYTTPSRTMGLVDEARAVARAATDVGIRIAFALAVRDQNPIAYGGSSEVLSDLPADKRKVIEEYFLRPAMSPREYIELTEEIAGAVTSPLVSVQFGPAGVQWCSKPLLELIAEQSHLTGRKVHMHFLETIYQRDWCDKNFPGGIIHYLKDIGLLSERLTLAHCTHARPDELEMIAQSNTRIVTNFSSNMHLHSGLAPIADAHKCGCGIAVGIDGLAFDEDDDSIREMRLVQKMHSGQGFHRNWTGKEFFGLVVRNGRHATGAPGTGELIPGQPADFAVIDFDRLDRDAITRVDPIDLFFARANATLVRSVVVNGKVIVENGAATGVDLTAIERELRAMYRVTFARQSALEDAWTPFKHALEKWYGHAGCS